MTKNTKVAIIIIVILIIYQHYYYSNIFHKNLIRKHADDIKFKTGDIIMFRFDTPVLYRNKDGYNTSTFICKAISTSVQYWYNGLPYLHTGIIVMIDNKPYVLHLTSDPIFDNFTQQDVVGLPSLSLLKDLNFYHGTLYHYKYNGPTNKLDLNDIYKHDIHINNSVLGVVCNNGLKIQKNKKYIACTDFVELVQYLLGIVNHISGNADIPTLIKHYDKTPTVIINPWLLHREL